MAEIASLSETALGPCRVRCGPFWLRLGTVVKRAGAALVAVLALTGCGSKPEPATMTFESRPDLTPPVFTVVKHTDGASSGYVFVAPKHDAPQKGPEIVDENGQPVWFDPVAGPDQAADFRVQTYKGKPVLTWWEGPIKSPILGTGYGHYVIADASYKRIVRVEAGLGKDSGDLHEFMYLDPNGDVVSESRRIVGDSLIWTRGDMTLRMETSLGRAAAIALAETIR